MKPLLRPLVFLIVLWVLDIVLRKGFILFFLPFTLPGNLNHLLFFTLFAWVSWYLSKRMAAQAGNTMTTLGVSFNRKNNMEFYSGLLIGILLWGMVALIQGEIAGFSWVLRPESGAFNLLYGLLFIFIADLGTELFTRPYPLTQLESNYGIWFAMVFMVAFVALKSISFEVSGQLLFFSILIPALHTVFFSFIYFKTKRIGGALGLHTGANFVTISVFDLRETQTNQPIPSGLFQSDSALDGLSMVALQMPYVLMAVLLSVATYWWWRKETSKTE
ncbi:CPBP family glutamic-type intramembrane protease [Sediminicola luteus]|uniref:CAAX prenyl protease 2/Lysostaphin resistance protein A-like domain-containing protein n=1 Tax=Sediminicola luteus TaxID=319238 RepID=A0A2A4GCZ2_9FLAO|nr:CPBP family glutamic-type intramembrane protease [Sediminicola luteus]PCE66323.1 hypothetical protein B7P33_03225 [Sediminicola luteus]